MAQVPPCSRVRRSISCLFWSTISIKLCWLFRDILRNLMSRNQILGVFIRMALIGSPEQVSEISQGLTGILSVLFCFLPWLDSWVVNPGVMSWYLDCWGGRKYYRLGAFHVGWSWAFGDPSFQTLIRTWLPGAYGGDSFEYFGSWLTPHKRLSCLNCSMSMV